MREKYLPVGTVVLLKNGTKRIMVNGFCTMDAKNPEKIYDYSGVLFPEGSLSSDQALLFDHDQIAQIDYIGLEDQEEKEFKVKLNQLMAAHGASATPAPAEPAQTTPVEKPIESTLIEPIESAPAEQVQPSPFEEIQPIQEPSITPLDSFTPVQPIQPTQQETPISPVGEGQF